MAVAHLSMLHRTRMGLTREELASRMHTSVPAASRLEPGLQLPSLATLAKPAGAVGRRVRVDIVGSAPIDATRHNGKQRCRCERPPQF
jgi:transcriptional regulator with XRE-family HTH domain